VKHPDFDNAHLKLVRGASHPPRLTRVFDPDCDPSPVAEIGDRVSTTTWSTVICGHQLGETAGCESGVARVAQKADSSQDESTDDSLTCPRKITRRTCHI
jgi:hypothetical protein